MYINSAAIQQMAKEKKLIVDGHVPNKKNIDRC